MVIALQPFDLCVLMFLLLFRVLPLQQALLFSIVLLPPLLLFLAAWPTHSK